MADYNIYIHATNGGVASPTASWGSESESFGAFSSGSGSPIKSWDSQIANSVIKTAGVAQNPDGLIGAAFSKLANSIPIVAAAIAVVKVVTSVVDTNIEYQVIRTGDYSGQIAWSNFKNNFRQLLQPISSNVEAHKQRTMWKIDDDRRAQNLELLGDSIINSYTRRGV